MTLDEFNHQRQARLLSMSGTRENDKAHLFATVGNKRTNASAKAIKDFSELIETQEYSHGQLSKAQYMAHPYRVANLLLKTFPKIEDDYIKLALCHNIIEVAGVGPELFETFGNDIMSYVKTLTVDRSRQWDWGYKKDYYEEISKNRITRIIKIFDKLDNMFVLSENNIKEVKMKYLSEINNYLMPFVGSDAPSIEAHFEALVNINYELID